MHRVAKPSLVLSGDFKENRFQIKTTLENKGYTVRNSLLVGGQKVTRSINLFKNPLSPILGLLPCPRKELQAVQIRRGKIGWSSRVKPNILRGNRRQTRSSSRS